MLHTALEVPTYESARYGTAGLVDSVATWDEESGELVIFAVNRGIEEATELAVRAQHATRRRRSR